jgi:hypothetical protein
LGFLPFDVSWPPEACHLRCAHWAAGLSTGCQPARSRYGGQSPGRRGSCRLADTGAEPAGAAGGQLTEVAGILEGTNEGELDEDLNLAATYEMGKLFAAPLFRPA